jgi:hypothetical protein
VPELVVEVPQEARGPGLEILRDDELLPMALWSAPLKLDPGEHTIRARESGRAPWETTVTLAEGAGIATVRVPVLEPLATPAVPSDPLPPKPAAEAEPDHARGRAQRVVGLALGGGGVAGLAASGVLGILSLTARDDAKKSCSETTNLCTSQQGVDARAAAISRGNASTALFVAGTALLAVGVVVWLTAPAPSLRPQAAAGAGPWAGVGGGF